MNQSRQWYIPDDLRTQRLSQKARGLMKMANPNLLNSLYEQLVKVKIFFEYIYIFLYS